MVAIRSVLLLVLAAVSAEQDADESCDGESAAASVMMLQQTLSVQAVAKAVQVPAPAVNERLQAALPIKFMHLPKTAGTSFFNAIFALPGVCLGDEPPVFDNTQPIISSLVIASCPGFSYESPQAHPCLQPLLPDGSGHFFGMLRQPEQRLMSLHNYFLRGKEAYDTDVVDPNDDIRVFFENARGGMVYQLTKDDPDERFCTRHDVDHSVVTDADVVEAVRVLQEDFAFVGITEQWDLSICLMHEMFGGDCTAEEFVIHNTHSTAPAEYDVSVLEGAVDTQDRILYEEALQLFQRNLEEFGVTAESCEQGCWATAGL